MDKTTSIHTVLIALIVFFSLGLSIKNWGFKTDDFSNLYHTAQIENAHDLLELFNDKSIETFCYPSGSTPPPSSFLSGLYRPMSFIYYWPQYYFFGASPYGYYLVTIALHTLNSALLFLLFLLFVAYGLAFLGALYFAFHPSLHNWLGWISAQTYQTELFVLLLLIFCLRCFFDTQQKIFYLLSLILFACNLLLKEATIFMPLWIIPASYLYLSAKTQNSTLTMLKKSFYTSLGFCFVSASYLATRALVFGFTPTGGTGNLTFELSWTSFITRQKARIFDFVSYVSDMIGLCWLPGNHQLLKGVLILSVCISLFILLIHNKNKLLIIFLYGSMLLFSWPALLMHYQPRYSYLGIPFFILAVIVSINSCDIKFSRITKFMSTFGFIILLGYNMLFLEHTLKARACALQSVTKSFTTLLKDQHIQKKPLYFFGLPHHWFAMCVAQAIWFLSGDDQHPVYHHGIVVEVDGFHNYLHSPKTNHHYLTIKPTSNGFTLTTSNIDKLWFCNRNLIEKQSTQHLTINQNILDQQPVFITWDYVYERFIIIDHEHIHQV